MFNANRTPIFHITSLFLLATLISGCATAPTATPAVPVAIVSSATNTPPTAPPAATTPAITISSTLDGMSALPHRVQWEVKFALPQGALFSRVEFLIDGKLARVERKQPYFYGGDNNYLVTTSLAPGEHSFTSRVVTFKGDSGEDTVKATVVIAANPPKPLDRTAWSRTETPAEVAESTSGQPGTPGPIGLTIDSVGWMFHDPQGGGMRFDVDYPSDGVVEMRAAIEEPPYPSYQYGGAFCEEPDAAILWSYKVSPDGKQLTLHPVTKEPCGDRLGAMEGTWTAVTK